MPRSPFLGFWVWVCGIEVRVSPKSLGSLGFGVGGLQKLFGAQEYTIWLRGPFEFLVWNQKERMLGTVLEHLCDQSK